MCIHIFTQYTNRHMHSNTLSKKWHQKLIEKFMHKGTRYQAYCISMCKRNAQLKKQRYDNRQIDIL